MTKIIASWLETARLISLSVGMAVCYGIIHDQITIRICAEYFTIGHPPVLGIEDLTVLAVYWGFVSTWWIGGSLGIIAALASQFGSWPKVGAAHVLRLVLGLLVIVGCGSFLAGIAGYFMASAEQVWLVEPLASQVPKAKHTMFLTDLWAHLAAYGIGIGGGCTICLWVFFCRRRMASQTCSL
jgi:hypothetical protein